MIPIAEIFGPTIQGEGPDAGLKTLFVRVAGCDFHCDWCDSKFAWKIDGQTSKYEEEELIEYLINKCKETKCLSIILTGGNPCLYNFSEIIPTLKKAGIKIGIETQGSILPNWLKEVDCLVISPKAPSSGQPDVMNPVRLFVNSEYRPENIAIKIPVFNEEDFQFAYKYYKEFCYLFDNNFRFYLSVGNADTEESGSIADRILTEYHQLIDRVMDSGMYKVYILPQIHTLVWGNKQGV